MSNPHWPLYDIRIRTDRLELRLATEDDLVALADVAAKGVHDPKTMPFFYPWTRKSSPDLERNLIQHHWKMRGEWTPEKWSFALAVLHDDEVVGSQSIKADDFAVRGLVETGSWLGMEHQGKGLGKEMRIAALNFIFNGINATEARTAAYDDNAPSRGVTESIGYEANGYHIDAVEGIAKPCREFVMTAERWKQVPASQLEVRIEGLGRAGKAMFGADSAPTLGL